MAVRRVPSQYSNISVAVAAASAGDTILVACGVYEESVTVSVDRLRIEGENPTCTILQGSGTGTGFDITASLVTISGFTVRDFEEGVRVQGSDNTIRNNRILNSAVGVLAGGQRNLVWDNSIANAGAGVGLEGGEGDHNYLVGNRITGAIAGIFNEQDNTWIAKNRISNCLIGITVTDSPSGSWVNDNEVRSSVAAIGVEGTGHQVYGNVCVSNGMGLGISGSGHMVLCNRFISSRGLSNSDGIRSSTTESVFYENAVINSEQVGYNSDPSSRNVLLANTLRANGLTGVLLNASDFNRVLSNRVDGNGTGIDVSADADDNVIEDNTVTAHRANGVVVSDDNASNNAIRRNQVCHNKPFDIQVGLPAFVAGNSFDLNRCGRSDPSSMCTRGC